MSGDFTGHDMAQAREDGYSAGVQLATQYERILTDLIAELRDWDSYYCKAAAADIADRAEARLREVQGE